VRIYDLLFGPPPSLAWVADRLDETVGHLRVELAAQWETDAKLEALWTLAVWV
jgi:hypothetical protein